jgi:hypothetical protein
MAAYDSQGGSAKSTAAVAAQGYCGSARRSLEGCASPALGGFADAASAGFCRSVGGAGGPVITSKSPNGLRFGLLRDMSDLLLMGGRSGVGGIRMTRVRKYESRLGGAALGKLR